MFANLPVFSSVMISATLRASDDTDRVHVSQPSER